MGKKTIVISLGGSQIIPNEINYSYLKKFKEIILKNESKYKFIIVCGGGSLARKYIEAIKKEKENELFQSFAGINATRANARFVSYFFGYNPKYGIPSEISTLKKYFKKRNIVICGALEYKPDQTSDSTAATIADKFKAQFVNLTDVNGLYTKDPKKFKNAKFISNISWKDFNGLVQKIKFKPGQHFVLDQNASKIIMKKEIPTYLIKNLNEFENFLKNKKFIGTTIRN